MSFTSVSAPHPVIFGLLTAANTNVETYAISVQKNVIYSHAQQLSVLALVPKVHVPGWTPVKPHNDVYPHFMTDGALCD
jgi:hypothetical protein